MVVRVADLLGHVLKNPKFYPGPHTTSQERTSTRYQKLDERRQLQLIWDAMVLRLSELLMEGKSVSIANLGTFSFKCHLHATTSGQDEVSKSPAFLPAFELKDVCTNYRANRDILEGAPDALTAAQSCPLKAVFLNEAPIAAGCFYRSNVVKSAISQIFKAVVDLTKSGYSLELQMGEHVLVNIKNKDVCVKFSKAYKEHCAKKVVAGKFKSGGTGAAAEIDPDTGFAKLSSTWKKPEFSAAMATFLPPPPDVEKARTAQVNLNMMSRDLTTVKN